MLHVATILTNYRSLSLSSIKPTLKKVPKFGVKIERMLLNARKEIGFTINLKAVKKDTQFKNEENPQAPEWSWKKDAAAKAGNGQQQSPNLNVTPN